MWCFSFTLIVKAPLTDPEIVTLITSCQYYSQRLPSTKGAHTIVLLIDDK